MSWPPDYANRIAYDRPTTDLRRYFDEEAHSDLLIQCGEDRIHVQKKILQTWSEHFKELLQSSTQTSDGSLVLEGDDPATLRALIKYIFSSPRDEDARRLNVLYKLARKYRVWSLVWDILITFSEYIELGYSGGKFYKAIELAYQMNESDHWPHAYIERACKHNIKQLVQDSEFFEMLKCTPQLFVDFWPMSSRGWIIKAIRDMKGFVSDARTADSPLLCTSPASQIKSGCVAGVAIALQQVRDGISIRDARPDHEAEASWTMAQV